MRKISFLPLPNKTKFKMKEPWFVYAPKSMTVYDLEKKLRQAANIYLREKLNDTDYKIDQCRLWLTSDSKWVDLDQLDQKYRYTSSCRVKLIPVSITES